MPANQYKPPILDNVYMRSYDFDMTVFLNANLLMDGVAKIKHLRQAGMVSEKITIKENTGETHKIPLRYSPQTFNFSFYGKLCQSKMNVGFNSLVILKTLLSFSVSGRRKALFDVLLQQYSLNNGRRSKKGLSLTFKDCFVDQYIINELDIDNNRLSFDSLLLVPNDIIINS